jgi:hypothetical protein
MYTVRFCARRMEENQRLPTRTVCICIKSLTVPSDGHTAFGQAYIENRPQDQSPEPVPRPSLSTVSAQSSQLLKVSSSVYQCPTEPTAITVISEKHHWPYCPMTACLLGARPFIEDRQQGECLEQ